MTALAKQAQTGIGYVFFKLGQSITLAGDESVGMMVLISSVGNTNVLKNHRSSSETLAR